MGITLTKDRDWAPIDGKACEVTNFMPFAKLVEGKVLSSDITKPYALIGLKCRENGIEFPEDTVGTIRHQFDFANLWTAFVERSNRYNEKVVVIWSKRNLKFSARIFAPFMPRLSVTVFENHAFKLWTDPNFCPYLKGKDRRLAEFPAHHQQPTVWKDRLKSNFYDE